MDFLALTDVARHFGPTRAVDGVSLALPERAFAALLGPSGCGKTTLLRLVAGLERPDGGRVAIGGREVAGPGRFVEPQHRDLGMVFQSYALWPHMSVEANVGFGLHRLARSERRARVAEALAMVGLETQAQRRPHALSGGQRQRVALARSLAARPRLLLLDEPLANLDAHLRQAMLAEFRRIHAATGCTVVFVTHDQNEALAVADRVGVMDRGRLEQLAPPAELFERPASPMVARFIGGGRTLPVAVSGRDARGLCRIAFGGREIAVPGRVDRGPGWLCLHARDLRPAPDGLPATVTGTRFEAGFPLAEIRLDAAPGGEALDLRVDAALPRGARLGVAVGGGWVLPREREAEPRPDGRAAA